MECRCKRPCSSNPKFCRRISNLNQACGYGLLAIVFLVRWSACTFGPDDRVEQAFVGFAQLDFLTDWGYDNIAHAKRDAYEPLTSPRSRGFRNTLGGESARPIYILLYQTTMLTRVDDAGPSQCPSHLMCNELLTRQHGEKRRVSGKSGIASQQQPALPRLTRQALSKGLGLRTRSRRRSSLTQRIEIWLDEVIAALQPPLPQRQPIVPFAAPEKKPAERHPSQDPGPRPRRGAGLPLTTAPASLGAVSAPAVIVTGSGGTGMVAVGKERPGGDGVKAQYDPPLDVSTAGCGGPFTNTLRKITSRLHIRPRGGRKNEALPEMTKMYSTLRQRPDVPLDYSHDYDHAHKADHREHLQYNHRMSNEDGTATTRNDDQQSMEQTIGSLSRTTVVSSDRRSAPLRERQERLKRAQRLLDRSNREGRVAEPS